MKKALSVLIVFSLVLALLAGCAKKEEDKKTADHTDYTAEDLAAALIASQSEPPEFYYVNEDDSVFAAYAALYLGAELAGSIKTGVICYPLGPLASEVAVFELDSADSAKMAPEPMAGYLSNREAAFYGYAPEESELAANGQVRVLGSFAVLWILRDSDAANAALEAAFSENAPTPPALSDHAVALGELEEPEDEPPEDEEEPTVPAVTTEPTTPPTKPDPPVETEPPVETAPPAETQSPVEPDPPVETAPPVETDPPEETMPPIETEPPTETEPPRPPEPTTEPEPPTEPEVPSEPDEYDHAKVLAALRNETDPGALMPKNRAVYDAVTDILVQIITPGMSDYEKELAVNDYLVFHAEYDPAKLSSGPYGTPDPDNTNPYGLLIHGVGICLGYATTFQLFMDVLGIECLTVRGFAHGWTEEHAWNLVRLEGDWYAVDVTWNDPVFTGWTPTQAARLAYAHVYFNVTSRYLRQTEHYWNQDVPEAEGTKYAYH